MPGRHGMGGAGGSGGGGGGSYSESAALVRSTEGMSYTEEGRQPTGAGSAGGGGTPHDGGEDELMDYVDSDVSVLAQFHEDAIRQAGFGYSQWLVLLVSGLGLAADAVELFAVPYILPSAEVELCIDDGQKAWLTGITFLGAMTGGVVWGNLADRMGRRRTLLSALGVNAVFSVIAAFMPTYGTFVTARLCSAVGVGGALPIVFAYYGEFLCKADRARHLSALLACWALGGALVAGVAWGVLPRTGADVVVESREHFSAWHQFLLVCALPSLAAVVGLVFLPESPRFLLEAGREVEAMMVYQRVYKANNPAAHAQYQLSELELPGKRPAGRGMASPGKSVLADMTYSFELFWNSFLQLLVRPQLPATLVLVALWFTAAFAHFGLAAWFPGYVQLLQTRDYNARTLVFVNASCEGAVYNKSIENVRWVDSSFRNCSFRDLTLSHVTFDNCRLEGVGFEVVKSSRTYFHNCDIRNSRFVDTDLSTQHFRNCSWFNNDMLSLSAGCGLDFDYNIHLPEAVREQLVGRLALLPGALACALTADRLGRARLVGLSLFLSAAAALGIWFLETDAVVLGLEAVFGLVFFAGWGALDIATVEAYPTHLRTTGFGFVGASCRLGGALGTLTFSNLVDTSRAVPMLTAVVVLLLGGLASVKMPDTGSVLL